MASANPKFRIAWNEHCFLLYSALVGVAGGLGAQVFVWLLDLAEQQNDRVVGIVSKRDVHHLFDRLLPAIDSSD